MENLEALRRLLAVNWRADLELALSENSIREVAARNDPGYLRWAFDVLDHWEAQLEEAGYDYSPPGLAYLLDGKAVGYLGSGDRQLLKDALTLSCDAFLTMERRLPVNAAKIKELTGIEVLTPASLWAVMEPWAALFC